MRRLLPLFLLLLAARPLSADVAASVAGPLTQDAFVSSLTRELTAHFNLEGDLQLELLRVWTPPQLVARDWQVIITEYPSVAASAMLLRCRILADGNPATEATITLRASHWRDAWVARQPLTHGATFDPALLEARRVDLFRDRDALPAAVGDQTFIFARAVNSGRTVTWRDIARRPLVKKGDMVEVSAAEGTLSITMKALALQSGAQGEAVTLRNLESRKDFTAFVVDENRVQVRF
ncbi:flagellar basal body P-ring formation protein FlgA [Oleiharenicola lentus]|jgi:flagella basal body P-ring formation protein FlgA|uniref:Flagella basal body P-ring formation protein FlgA n=1 Tax=Oleiharenicola lentus TaxID=2508720 RepID=A0A4Q1C3W6_9BACT|nr:flagellar basal body P-ring formation chaperone FlgA [Oleiharenicola lentus]RXK52945.1 flagellar basal body P-ring formation protein FlgA [Oleiharenicola lentus]